jgi:hypothetical protein
MALVRIIACVAGAFVSGCNDRDPELNRGGCARSIARRGIEQRGIVETTPEWLDLVIGSLHIIVVLLIWSGIYLAARETGGPKVLDEPASPAEPVTPVRIVTRASA